VYERHDPEALALHRVVRENLATFYAAIEEGWQTGLPEFVRAEFAGFLDCSVMQGGFAHLACEDFNLHAKTTRVPSTTTPEPAFCATFCAHRFRRNASPSCLTTGSG